MSCPKRNLLSIVFYRPAIILVFFHPHEFHKNIFPEVLGFYCKFDICCLLKFLLFFFFFFIALQILFHLINDKSRCLFCPDCLLAFHLFIFFILCNPGKNKNID